MRFDAKVSWWAPVTPMCTVQAELVAKFIDAELRSGGKAGKSDDELEATLDKALMLFRYIQARAALPARAAADLLWCNMLHIFA